MSRFTDLQFSTRRVEALTDGVFAIAMTLLILDVKIGDLGEVSSSAQLWHAFGSIESNLINCVVSFLLLGGMWAVHMRQFEFIKHADRHLVMINTLRLLVVVAIPLTTSAASAYDTVVLGRILFPLNFLLLALMSWWEWDYAVKIPGNDVDPKLITESRRRNILISSSAMAVVVLSVWIGELAFLLFAVTPFIGQYLNRSKKS
jgi:uncharacterized membrane protein